MRRQREPMPLHSALTLNAGQTMILPEE
jgi:hypothetical protein